MGQDHSAGSRAQEAEAYGNVFVKIDQDTYLSDDTLFGTVFVQLRRPYPGDKICLKVKGKEFTKWIDKEHKQRQREDGTIEHYTVDVPRESEFVSVKHVVDIYDWHSAAMIPPGQYSFPISFKIPAGLPSSFFLRSGTTVAEVAYYVEAYLKPEKDLYPKIKHKRPVTIRQALKSDITTKEVSINQEVSTCCCCSKGSVAMWTAFEKNAYAPGEQARIVTEVDNSKCELAITNIRFELVQYIKLTAQNNAKALHFGIVGENLGRVEPGEAFLKEERKEASIYLPPAIEGSGKSYRGDNTVQEYNLSPQQAISPSTNGTLIKSTFGLRVSCGMDGCVCDTMPSTELPVIIYSILQRKVSDPTPPPGWNPTPMPGATVTIIVNSNGVATGVNINTGAAQPQSNSLMANNQMPPQQSIEAQPQPQYQQQTQVQPQPQYQQQAQPQYQQQSQPQYQQQQAPIQSQNQYQAQPLPSQRESQRREQPLPQYQQSQNQIQQERKDPSLIQSEQQIYQYLQGSQRKEQPQPPIQQEKREQPQYQPQQVLVQPQNQYQAQPLSQRESQRREQPLPQYQQQLQSQYIQESSRREQPLPQYQQEKREQPQIQSEQRREQPQYQQSQQYESQRREQPQLQYQQEQRREQSIPQYQSEQRREQPQYQQEAQYQRKEQPQPQYQQERREQARPQYIEERRREQPQPSYQQESQHREYSPQRNQQESPQRYQQESPSRYQQESPPRYQQESPSRYQQESPSRYQQESQYLPRDQAQPQYQQERREQPQYQQYQQQNNYSTQAQKQSNQGYGGYNGQY